MIDLEFFRKTVLSFPETMEQPHFEKLSFRVRKRIFATFDVTSNLACVKLSEIDQNVFSYIKESGIFPVPGNWGKQGWTYINIELVSEEIFKDALTTAYETVAPKKLVAMLKSGKIEEID